MESWPDFVALRPGGGDPCARGQFCDQSDLIDPHRTARNSRPRPHRDLRGADRKGRCGLLRTGSPRPSADGDRVSQHLRARPQGRHQPLPVGRVLRERHVDDHPYQLLLGYHGHQRRHLHRRRQRRDDPLRLAPGGHEPTWPHRDHDAPLLVRDAGRPRTVDLDRVQHRRVQKRPRLRVRNRFLGGGALLQLRA